MRRPGGDRRAARPAVDAFFRGAHKIDALVSLTGFSLVGGPAYNDSRAAEAILAQLDVPYIDIRPMTVDTQGKYQAYYQDKDGTPKLFRAGDGVHMSMNGYIRITKGLADRTTAIRLAPGMSVVPEVKVK